jgi:L-ascorbate metabolism protein UlaG (beta-lactamase superfamily)
MRQRNTAYLFEMDGLHVLHMGDIVQPLSAHLQERLSVAEVLLVPAGAGCTLKLAQVIELIQALNPRIVVPMHYKVPGAQSELLELDSFLKEMGIKTPEFQARLNVTSSSLPPDTRVAALQPQAQPS